MTLEANLGDDGPAPGKLAGHDPCHAQYALAQHVASLTAESTSGTGGLAHIAMRTSPIPAPGLDMLMTKPRLTARACICSGLRLSGTGPELDFVQNEGVSRGTDSLL